MKNWNFLGDFSVDPGGSGGHPGGSRTDSGGEKVWKNEIFKNWLRSNEIAPYLGDPKFYVKNPVFYEQNRLNPISSSYPKTINIQLSAWQFCR